MARILLIDDNEMAREAFQYVLAEQGHEVILAEDGEKGLELFKDQQMDLIITDVIMPKLDGIAVILEILKVQPGLPIIAISGGMKISGAEYLEDAKLFGAVITLEKPIENNVLIRAVEQCFAGDARI